MFLLDTNVLSALIRGNDAVISHMRNHSWTALVTSSVVMAELWSGALHAARPPLLKRIAGLQFEVLPFDERDARRAGEIRAALLRAGTPIGAYDTLIAGQALARDLTLVTHNTREFIRVPGLRLEDWQA